MNPVRRRRLLFVLLALLVAGAATALIAMALQRNVAYLYTPNEVLTGEAGANVTSGEARFRLGGMVAADSLKRTPGTLDARFEVDDGDARLPVVYTGILPDLFREGKGVVAQGKLADNGLFTATEVLAKHDENYMPPEAQHAVDQAQKTIETLK